MTKKIFLNCILILCLILFGCSHTNPETTAFDILKSAYEKTNSLETIKISSTIEGSTFNFSDPPEQLLVNYTTVYAAEKDDSKIYSLFVTTYDNYVTFQVSCRKENQIQDVFGVFNETLGKCFYTDYSEHEIQNELAFLSVDSLLYYKPAYEFTFEKEETEYIITEKIIDSDKMLELTTEKMLETDPDYDPLITSDGVHLPKREYHGYKEYHINKEGYITSIIFHEDNEYGIGYDDYVQNDNLSNFNEKLFDKNQLDELFEGVLSGDIEQYSDITEYIVWE